MAKPTTSLRPEPFRELFIRKTLKLVHVAAPVTQTFIRRQVSGARTYSRTRNTRLGNQLPEVVPSVMSVVPDFPIFAENLNGADARRGCAKDS